MRVQSAAPNRRKIHGLRKDDTLHAAGLGAAEVILSQ